VRVLIALFCVSALACSESDPKADPADAAAPQAEAGATPDAGAIPDAGETPDAAPPGPVGLEAAAEIRFDGQGVPHIRAASKRDALYLQGWATAHQRSFQMDYMRRQAYGTRAEVYGPDWLEDDKGKRVLGLRQLAEANLAWYAQQHPQVHAEVLAYTAGVNRWLEQAKAGEHPRPGEFDRVGADYWPPEWTPQDTVAIAKLIVLANTFGADQEVLGVAASLLLGEDTFRDVFRFQPMMSTYATEPGPGDESRFPQGMEKARPQGAAFADRFKNLPPTQKTDLAHGLVALAHKLAGLRDTGLGVAAGSNSYAIAGTHTEGDGAILCNEFHQPIVAPNRFMAVHMVVEGGDPMGLFGYTIPGLPYVLGGHTGAVAFGITAAFADVTDLYAETLNGSRDAVLFRGEWVPIEVREETIRVKPADGDWKSPDEETVTVQWVPHHGPIVNGLLPGQIGALVSATGLVLSARWPGFSAETSTAATISAIWDAPDLDAARAALNLFDGGPMNWTLADSAGAVGYTNAGPWPVREWTLTEGPPWAPLDGQGEFEWSRVAPPSEAVDDLRPAKGYHVDANGIMTEQNLDGDPLNDDRYLQHFADLGTRAWRLTELVHAATTRGAPVALEEAVSWQADNLSVFAVELLPTLRGVGDRLCPDPDDGANADACEAVALLEAWDLQQSRGSAAATIFNTWLTHVVHRVLRQRLNPTILGVIGGFMYSLGARDVVAWARRRAPVPAVAWIDDPETEDVVETLDDHAVAALGEALGQLRGFFGDEPMASWAWERVHQLQVNHIVFGDLSLEPQPRDGGPNTVNTSDYSGTEADGRVVEFPLTATNGPIFRFCVQLAGDATRGTHVLAGGQGGHLEQAHWMSQLDSWGTHGEVATPLSAADVEAQTSELVRFEAD
jgi:penicillin G amidase